MTGFLLPMCRKMWVPEQSLSRSQKVNPFCLTPAADAAAPVGHAACTSFQRVSPWLNVHFAHSDTALKRLISQPHSRTLDVEWAWVCGGSKKETLAELIAFSVAFHHLSTTFPNKLWSNMVKLPHFLKRKLQVIENQLLANLVVPRAGIEPAWTFRSKGF